MPIEIRELLIKVNVEQPRGSGGEGSSQPVPVSASEGQEKDPEKIVATALEQMAQIMKDQKER